MKHVKLLGIGLFRNVNNFVNKEANDAVWNVLDRFCTSAPDVNNNTYTVVHRGRYYHRYKSLLRKLEFLLVEKI